MFNPEKPDANTWEETPEKRIRRDCAWCDKILEDIPEVDRNNPKIKIEITHGICEDCHKKEIDGMKERTIKRTEKPE